MPGLRRSAPAIATETPARVAAAFSWMSFSRFVEVFPVRTGWLVVWGVYEEMGAVRKVAGQRLYPTLDGARPRVAAAIRTLTGDDALVRECLVRFDRTEFPEHRSPPLPEPL
ncbi:MAG: hypothetical protein ACKOWF_19440 [Chloroflexota bacterium]